MSFPGQALLQDPAGILLGYWRRLRGQATGEPDYQYDKTGALLRQQAMRVQYMPMPLAELIRENPRRHEALSVLAQVQLKAKDWDAALATGITLRHRFPNVYDGYQVLASALRGQGRLDKSEAVTLAALRRFPRSARIAIQYVTCAQAMGDVVEALRRCESVVRRFPNDRWLQFQYISIATAAKQAAKAADMAAHCVRCWPDEWDAWILHVDLAGARGDWATAVEGCREMLARFSGRPESHWRAAKALRMAGDIAGASAIIDTGTFLFPRNQELQREREAVIAAQGRVTVLPDSS